MYSTEQRRLAIETFIRFAHSYADTITELGYPTPPTLRAWWREYDSTEKIPMPAWQDAPRYSEEQRRRAVEHYHGHGRGLARTMGMLGYPGSSKLLASWIDELVCVLSRRRAQDA